MDGEERAIVPTSEGVAAALLAEATVAALAVVPRAVAALTRAVVASTEAAGWWKSPRGWHTSVAPCGRR